mmetsp:Transcript_58066/g.168320  ORF Transcript_58066/g.168320 Transcript_58066/m.168320 type:complete len:537 (-) Transcript_58066:110-1720(-)
MPPHIVAPPEVGLGGDAGLEHCPGAWPIDVDPCLSQFAGLHEKSDRTLEMLESVLKRLDARAQRRCCGACKERSRGRPGGTTRRRASFVQPPSLMAQVDSVCTMPSDETPPLRQEIAARIRSLRPDLSRSFTCSDDLDQVRLRSTQLSVTLPHVDPQRSMSTMPSGGVCTLSSGAKRFSQWISASMVIAEEDLKRWDRRKKVWQFLEDKQSSWWAGLYYYAVTLFLGVCIVLSILDLLSGVAVYRAVLTCFEGVLALELVLRYVVCPNRHVFWLDIYHVIDLLVFLASAIPLVIVVVMDLSPELAYSVRVFNPLMLSLRYLRRFDHFHLLVHAFRETAEALPVLVFTWLLIALFHSGLIYLLEPRERMPHLGEAVWFTMTTMSTVGYAEAPSTTWGRAASLVLSTVSALYLAIPIGIMGNTFSTIWQDRDRHVHGEQMRRRIARGGYTPWEIIDIFKTIDKDRSGSLTFDEFRTFLEIIHIHMSDALARRIFESFDDDGEGAISFEEFLLRTFPAHHFYMRMSRATRSDHTDSGTS